MKPENFSLSLVPPFNLHGSNFNGRAFRFYSSYNFMLPVSHLQEKDDTAN